MKVYASLIVIANIILNVRSYVAAKNTYLCITNQRLIKRSGAFTDNFVHYSLKNIGNVELLGSIFDKKGEKGSSTLIVTSKDFHTDTYSKDILVIRSLYNAYEVYRVITETTDGYNESFRLENLDNSPKK